MAKMRRAWPDDVPSRWTACTPVPGVFTCRTDRRTYRVRWICGYTYFVDVVVGEENDVVGLERSIEATWQHRDVLQAIHSIPYLHLRPFHPFPSTGYGSNTAIMAD